MARTHKSFGFKSFWIATVLAQLLLLGSAFAEPNVQIVDKKSGHRLTVPMAGPVTVTLTSDGWRTTRQVAEPPPAFAARECRCTGRRFSIARVAGGVAALIIGLSLASLVRSLARRR